MLRIRNIKICQYEIHRQYEIDGDNEACFYFAHLSLVAFYICICIPINKKRLQQNYKKHTYMLFMLYFYLIKVADLK